MNPAGTTMSQQPLDRLLLILLTVPRVARVSGVARVPGLEADLTVRPALVSAVVRTVHQASPPAVAATAVAVTVVPPGSGCAVSGRSGLSAGCGPKAKFHLRRQGQSPLPACRKRHNSPHPGQLCGRPHASVPANHERHLYPYP